MHRAQSQEGRGVLFLGVYISFATELPPSSLPLVRALKKKKVLDDVALSEAEGQQIEEAVAKCIASERGEAGGVPRVPRPVAAWCGEGGS